MEWCIRMRGSSAFHLEGISRLEVGTTLLSTPVTPFFIPCYELILKAVTEMHAPNPQPPTQKVGTSNRTSLTFFINHYDSTMFKKVVPRMCLQAIFVFLMGKDGYMYIRKKKIICQCTMDL